MLKFIFILSMLTSLSQSFATERASDLKSFSSDFCTMFPNGTLNRTDAWKHCCYDHDLRYWFGGTRGDELNADKILRSCVTKAAGSFYGSIMYYGVRSGHYSPVKNEHKWGWGWTPTRKLFSKLSIIEKEVINKNLNYLNLEESYLRSFRAIYEL